MAFARSVEGEWLFYNSHWWCFCPLLYNVYAMSFQKSTSTSGLFTYRAWWAGLRLQGQLHLELEPMDQFGVKDMNWWTSSLVKPQMFLLNGSGRHGDLQNNPIDDRRLGRRQSNDENRADACIIFESPFQYSCCFVFPPFSPQGLFNSFQALFRSFSGLKKNNRKNPFGWP